VNIKDIQKNRDWVILELSTKLEDAIGRIRILEEEVARLEQVKQAKRGRKKVVNTG
jgi:hypothetical protein